jgi:excisionase family DNA binding protein
MELPENPDFLREFKARVSAMDTIYIMETNKRFVNGEKLNVVLMLIDRYFPLTKKVIIGLPSQQPVYANGHKSDVSIDPDNLASVNDIAALLNVSDTTVYNLIYRGELPYIKLGKLYRIPLDKFQDWISTSSKYSV